MANQDSTLTQEQVKSLFDYKDGDLYWKNTKKLSALINQDGYKRSYINGKTYYNHRIIWLFHYGFLPKQLDHIDGNPSNNHIENLREVTNSQNQQNKNIGSNNKSGIKNVHWSNSMKKWCVQITVDKKIKTVGFYECLNEAGLAAKEARSSFYGEYANHG